MVANRQQPLSPTPQASPTLARVALEPRTRGLLVGETGSGKSTLAEALITHWRAHQPNSRILIVDSKPRFRAEYELNGIPTKRSRRYRGMDHGAAIQGSYVLPLHNPREELKQVWRLGGDVAVAQVSDIRATDVLEETMAAYFEDSRAKYNQLAYIDELPDFFGSSPGFRRGHSVMKLVRSGREKGIAVLAGAQRPRNIPVAMLSELRYLYAYWLANKEDWKHLRNMGLPEHLAPPEEQHVFLFYDKHKRASGQYRLKV